MPWNQRRRIATLILCLLSLSLILIFLLRYWTIVQFQNNYSFNSSVNLSKKILLVWRLGTGEREQTFRFAIAAQRLGIELRVVNAQTKNFFEKIWIKNPVETAASLMQPDLILTIENGIKSLDGYHNYIVLDRAINSYITQAEDELIIKDHRLERYYGLLPTFPEIEKLDATLANSGHRPNIMQWYPTVQSTNYLPQKPTRLFYPGGVVRDITRSSKKYKEMFSILDKYKYLYISGSRERWQHTPNSIRTPVPFDGVTLLEVQNMCGASLVLHDQEHLSGNVPSSRIFEAAAANTIIISDKMPFIQEIFGNNILYVDVNKNSESIATEINQHMQWIIANPEAAREMAHNCHKIFLNKYTLEKQLEKLIDFDHLSRQTQPNIVINAISKSGSTYLTKLLESTLQYEKKRLYSKYNYENKEYSNNLTDFFHKHKRIIRTHLAASPIHLSDGHDFPYVLDIKHFKQYTNKLIVHLRDPRQATLSRVHHLERFKSAGAFSKKLPKGYFNLSWSKKIDWNIEHYLPTVVQWIQSYHQLKLLEDKETNGLQILFTTYDELIKNEDALAKKILNFYNISTNDLIIKKIKKDENVNFRNGNPKEWLDAFTSQQKNRMLELIPNELLVRYGWNYDFNT